MKKVTLEQIDEILLDYSLSAEDRASSLFKLVGKFDNTWLDKREEIASRIKGLEPKGFGFVKDWWACGMVYGPVKFLKNGYEHGIVEY